MDLRSDLFGLFEAKKFYSEYSQIIFHRADLNWSSISFFQNLNWKFKIGFYLNYCDLYVRWPQTHFFLISSDFLLEYIYHYLIDSVFLFFANFFVLIFMIIFEQHFGLAESSSNFHFKNEFNFNFCSFYSKNQELIIDSTQTFVLSLEIRYFEYVNYF